MRCWWHLTLHIVNVEKNVSRLLFDLFFFFTICLCITLIWLGWGLRWWCFDVLFFISEFHFFYWLLFYFRLLVYICVVGVYYFFQVWYIFVFWYRLFVFCFVFLLLFIYLLVFILIENFPLKNRARLYVARCYFVVDKKKRLLDKLVELLQFYVEIIFIIRSSFSSTENAHFCYSGLTRKWWAKNIVPNV